MARRYKIIVLQTTNSKLYIINLQIMLQVRKINSKGQAALEFMTTYGWAILAIILAISTLYYFDVLDPDKYIQTSCNTGNQIECVEAVIYTNGDFGIRLRNNNPVDLDIEIGVTMPDGTALNINSETIGKGESKEFTDSFGLTFLQGNKVDMTIAINFRREGAGGSYYTTKGTAVLKAIPN